MVALLLMLFLRGPGSVTGDGEPAAKSGSPDRSEPVSFAETYDVLLKSDTREGGPADHEQVMLSDKTLIVLIDDHKYLVQVSGNEAGAWHSVELERLIEIAQQASGDSNGIRVRIHKKVTSRASAEHKILTALEQAGISRDAIFELSELID